MTEPTPRRALGERANQYKQPFWRRMLGGIADRQFDRAASDDSSFIIKERTWRGETRAEASERIDTKRQGRLYQRHAKGGQRAERQDPHARF